MLRSTFVPETIFRRLTQTDRTCSVIQTHTDELLLRLDFGKNMNCNLKLHSQRLYRQTLRALYAAVCARTTYFFFVYKNFSSFRLQFPGKNCRQRYGKSNTSVWRKLSKVTAPKILCCRFSLQLIFFFRTAVLRKLFFSYQHCNFSGGCLLVKMAFKTVTRSVKIRSLCNINID